VDRAIVTGAGGFIGTALVNELHNNGVEVYAIVRRNAVSKTPLSQEYGVHYIECNMDEYSLLYDKIDASSIDVFYHMAWEGSAGPLRADVPIQLRNVQHAVDAVKAAKQLNCKCFCGAGSIMEYEAEFFIPQRGSQPIKSYIYSSAKLAAHFMTKTIAADLSIPFVWGIISNAYGAGEISQRFINTTIKKLLKESSVDFTEGHQYYDFLYVSDMARAFYLLGMAGKPFSSYYLGSGNARPLKEYVEVMRDCVAPNVGLNFGAIPFNGVYLPLNIFDTSDLVKDTGFCPSIPFEEGIRLTAEWIKKEKEKV